MWLLQCYLDTHVEYPYSEVSNFLIMWQIDKWRNPLIVSVLCPGGSCLLNAQEEDETSSYMSSYISALSCGALGSYSVLNNREKICDIQNMVSLILYSTVNEALEYLRNDR